MNTVLGLQLLSPSAVAPTARARSDWSVFCNSLISWKCGGGKVVAA